MSDALHKVENTHIAPSTYNTFISCFISGPGQATIRGEQCVSVSTLHQSCCRPGKVTDSSEHCYSDS